MMIAYVRSNLGRRFTGTSRNRAYYQDIVSSNGSHGAPLAHVPEGMFARVTLCGKGIAELVAVEEDADIKVCKVCQSRLAGLVKRLPGCALVQEILGNNLLPAGDH